MNDHPDLKHEDTESDSLSKVNGDTSNLEKLRKVMSPNRLSDLLAKSLPASSSIDKLKELSTSYLERIQGFGGSRALLDEMSEKYAAAQVEGKASLKLYERELMDLNTHLKNAFEVNHLKANKAFELSEKLKDIKNIIERSNYRQLSIARDLVERENSRLHGKLYPFQTSGKITDLAGYERSVSKTPSTGTEEVIISEDDYGVKIKDIRKSKNLSQEALAALADVSVVTIKKIEAGKGNPSLKTILKINEVLNTKLALL